MLVVGITVTYVHSRFPAWLAVLPVIGATLLIAAGPRAWINRYFLGNRVMVAIGLISYARIKQMAEECISTELMCLTMLLVG
ncbi:MAG TPA: hypothetical protein DCW35_02890 [Polynucleobacter sp.]|nr:hypothetical protein [Polynucleobacter sp.]